MPALIRAITSRIAMFLGMLATAACGNFPEPATEQPRLSAWVAERYGTALREAQIVRINCYSERFEKPVVVQQREGFHIYFPYEAGRPLVVFLVEMRDARPVVKYDGPVDAVFGTLTANMAWVIEQAIRYGQTAVNSREAERRAG